MEELVKITSDLSHFLWGMPVPVILIGTGIFISIVFNGSFIFRWITHFRNTYGQVFKPVGGTGTISSFAAACTAMSNTIGTGNIAGVSTAIAAGGPGALVWMWVTGFLGCSTKAAEIIIGQRYLVKFDNVDEYVCDRSFAMRNAFGWKILPFILAIATSLATPWVCIVQVESVSSACVEAFNANSYFVIGIVGISVLAVIAGGLRRISQVMETCIPFMAIAYMLGVFVILVMYYDQIIPTFELIFTCAFSPTAAVGGFAGATVRDAMRYRVARGMFSNDAGLGYGIIAHSPATTDHPVRQGSWGWGEVFVDTIVIYTMSGLAILMTGVYHTRPDVSVSSYVTAAFGEAFGVFGGGYAAIIVCLFAWTTIIGTYYASENTVKYLIGDNKWTRIACYCYMIYFILPGTFFAGLDAALL
jgi:amino acid carrier protein